MPRHVGADALNVPLLSRSTVFPCPALQNLAVQGDASAAWGQLSLGHPMLYRQLATTVTRALCVKHTGDLLPYLVNKFHSPTLSVFLQLVLNIGQDSDLHLLQLALHISEARLPFLQPLQH